jgi:hypothetical protein
MEIKTILEYLLPKITFHKITVTDLKSIANQALKALYICEKVNKLIDENLDLQTLDLGINQSTKIKSYNSESQTAVI